MKDENYVHKAKSLRKCHFPELESLKISTTLNMEVII